MKQAKRREPNLTGKGLAVSLAALLTLSSLPPAFAQRFRSSARTSPALRPHAPVVPMRPLQSPARIGSDALPGLGALRAALLPPAAGLPENPPALPSVPGGPGQGTRSSPTADRNYSLGRFPTDSGGGPLPDGHRRRAAPQRILEAAFPRRMARAHSLTGGLGHTSPPYGSVGRSWGRTLESILSRARSGDGASDSQSGERGATSPFFDFAAEEAGARLSPWGMGPSGTGHTGANGSHARGALLPGPDKPARGIVRHGDGGAPPEPDRQKFARPGQGGPPPDGRYGIGWSPARRPLLSAALSLAALLAAAIVPTAAFAAAIALPEVSGLWSAAWLAAVPVAAGALFWDGARVKRVEALKNLGELGFKDPRLRHVTEAAGRFYDEARKLKPKGRLGGRKEAFTQRDLMRAWAMSFRENYRRLLLVAEAPLAALLSFQQAVEFSYGAGLDYDPSDPKVGDRGDFEVLLLKSLHELARGLGLAAGDRLRIPAPAGKDDFRPDWLRWLDELCRKKARLPMDPLLDKAEAALDGLPHRRTAAPPGSLEPSGAVERGLDEVNRGFIREAVKAGEKIAFPSAHRLLRHLTMASDLRLPVLLVGPTGTGKSASVKWLAANNEVAHLGVAMKPAVGKEDMIGSVRPVPGGLAWQWGFLIKAIVNGDWVTLEEVNLAPSEVLEFLNEFLNSGFIRLTQYESLDEETLRRVLPPELFKALKADGFVLRPHYKFRLFLTMNPDFYNARNKLAQTLMNRTVQIWAPDYWPREIELILEMNGLGPGRAVELVENVYAGFKRKVHTGHIGRGHKDKYEINLRTLLRAVGLYKDNLALYSAARKGRKPDAKTDMLLWGRALWEALGAMMRSEVDRQELWLLLDAGIGFNKFGISRADLAPVVTGFSFDEKTREVTFEDDLLPLKLPLKPGGAFVPPDGFDLPPTPRVLGDLYWMARRLLRKEHMLLVGETAAGKTAQTQYLHRLAHAALYYTNLSSESADEELGGGFQPDPAKPGEFRFVPGLLERAGKEYDGKGTSLFIDEFNLNTLVEWFNTAQDDGILVTPAGVVKLGPETVMIGAMNPPSYQGRNVLSPAIRGRYWERWVDEPDGGEAALRLGARLRKLLEEDAPDSE